MVKIAITLNRQIMPLKKSKQKVVNKVIKAKPSFKTAELIGTGILLPLYLSSNVCEVITTFSAQMHKNLVK